MSKPWYRFFLVTDDQAGEAGSATVDGSDPSLRGAPADATLNDGRRVADLVQDADVTFTDAGTNLTALNDIYRSAQIAVPPHGYTVLKVSDMLHSDHIRTLPADVKRKSILVALDAAGVTVDEIVQDAVHRDRALDTYERVLQKNLEEFRSGKLAENARLEREIGERLAELRTRIDQNKQGVALETENLHAWQSRKQEEERRIAEAVSYFVVESPVSTIAPTARIADDKGDVNAG